MEELQSSKKREEEESEEEMRRIWVKEEVSSGRGGKTRGEGSMMSDINEIRARSIES